jgi:hypothetical protein
MTADDAFQQALVREVIEAAISAVTLARSVKQREVLRRSRFEKLFLQSVSQQLRMRRTDESAHDNRRAIRDRRDGFSGSDDSRSGSHVIVKANDIPIAEAYPAGKNRVQSCAACSTRTTITVS